MMKRPAGKSAEQPQQADTKYLEHEHCETIREIVRTLHAPSLNRFTYSLIDSLWADVSVALHHLERLPEATFGQMMEVIAGLTEARNELRHACFLFDVEEINSVHRLLMRNRAMLTGREILRKALRVWPVLDSSA